MLTFFRIRNNYFLFKFFLIKFSFDYVWLVIQFSNIFCPRSSLSSLVLSDPWFLFVAILYDRVLSCPDNIKTNINNSSCKIGQQHIFSQFFCLPIFQTIRLAASANVNQIACCFSLKRK